VSKGESSNDHPRRQGFPLFWSSPSVVRVTNGSHKPYPVIDGIVLYVLATIATDPFGQRVGNSDMGREYGK